MLAQRHLANAIGRRQWPQAGGLNEWRIHYVIAYSG